MSQNIDFLFVHLFGAPGPVPKPACRLALHFPGSDAFFECVVRWRVIAIFAVLKGFGSRDQVDC